MRKWMMAAGIALMALPAVAEGAYSTNESCCCSNTCNDCCCGRWTLEGIALYWRTCIDNQVYALNQTTENSLLTQEPRGVRADNEWGFRIKGKYASCDDCKFATLSYLYFDETDNSFTANPTVTTYFSSSANSIAAKISSEYQRLDGRIGHYCCHGCNGGLYGYGGVSWVYIDQNKKLTGVNSDSTEEKLTQSSRYNAAGFEAGLGGHYKICGGFGLGAEVGGIATIGEREGRFFGNVIESSTSFTINKIPSVTFCAPGLDLRLEAFYECCYCGFNWAVMVGYEQQYYWSVLRFHPLFAGGSPSLPSQVSLREDFGVGGLYFGGRVGY